MAVRPQDLVSFVGALAVLGTLGALVAGNVALAAVCTAAALGAGVVARGASRRDPSPMPYALPVAPLSAPLAHHRPRVAGDPGAEAFLSTKNDASACGERGPRTPLAAHSAPCATSQAAASSDGPAPPEKCANSLR
jgi:hypothetical protein